MKTVEIYEDDQAVKDRRNPPRTCLDVEDALGSIRRLDGVRRTSVAFELNDDLSMLIGGGNDGRYVVQIIRGVDEEFFTLLAPDRVGSDELLVVAGGQTGHYPVSQVVDLTTVLHAVRFFLETGRPAPDVAWRHEG